jgi:hypothetical protein
VLKLAGRISLTVNVADFLELERAFKGKGVISVPADKINMLSIFEQ